MELDDICHMASVSGSIVYCDCIQHNFCKYQSKYKIPHSNGREVSGRMYECYKYKPEQLNDKRGNQD